jgi:hypothetical protein
VTTRRIIKAASLAGTLAAALAAALAATPAHACLILVGGPQPAGTIAVPVDFAAADESARPESGSVPGGMPVPRRSRCGRHFGYVPGPAPIDLVRGQTSSEAPPQGAGSFVEFVSLSLEREFRLTVEDLFPEERRRRPPGR